MILPSKIVFADARIKTAFEALQTGSFEEKRTVGFLLRAFRDIEENAFCGTQISKKLIPKEYRKFGIDNLWKYDLPDGWRLMYSVGKKELVVISIILEWLDHKSYERRFGY